MSCCFVLLFHSQIKLMSKVEYFRELERTIQESVSPEGPAKEACIMHCIRTDFSQEDQFSKIVQFGRGGGDTNRISRTCSRSIFVCLKGNVMTVEEVKMTYQHHQAGYQNQSGISWATQTRWQDTRSRIYSLQLASVTVYSATVY